MTRRARGRSAWARGLPALGGACLVVSSLALSSCDSRFEFEPLTESEGGTASGGRFGGFGGLGGFGDGFGYGGLAGGFGVGSTGGASRGGTGNGGDEECLGGCADAGLKCNEGSKLCVECLVDEDCGAQARCGRENPIANRCVQCLEREDCGDNQVCAESTHTCVWWCSDSNKGQCAFSGLTCSTILGYCAGCFDKDDCNDNERQPYCLPSRVRCAACTDDKHCEGDGDAANHCDPVLFICVECRSSRDCDEGQVCNRESHVCQDSLVQR